MRYSRHVAVIALASAIAGSAVAVADQQRDDAPASADLMKMVNTERAFVRRAQETNWRHAFLEFFADGIKGFEGEDVKERLRSRPEPPKGLEFWWEPRFGDIAASGELGWLTGPVRTRAPQAPKPDFGNYTSVWKRQPDGTYRVIQDIGVSIPDLAPFPPGFSRAPAASRYSGREDHVRAQTTLRQADSDLTAALRASGGSAYVQVAAPFVRMHRNGIMPIAGREALVKWSVSQGAWSGGETRFAEAAASGDLGYTWGSYKQPVSADTPAATGHYLRIWTRDAHGRWLLAVDVLKG